MGIKTDIGLVGTNYQWLGSVFYFGYLVCTITLDRRYPMANVCPRVSSGQQFGYSKDFRSPNIPASVSLLGELP
jgi:hypothetical protein